MVNIGLFNMNIVVLLQRFMLFVIMFLCLPALKANDLCFETLSFTHAAQKRTKPDFKGNQRDKFGSNSISYSFFPLINNGFSVDYDRKLVDRHWLKISPTYHTAINHATLRNESIRNLQGVTAGIYHRYNYFEIERAGFQTFFQWGVNYSMFNIEAADRVQTHIQKVGLDLVIGFRQIIARPLFIDFYIGYGNRWMLKQTQNVDGAVTTDVIEANLFQENMFDYGHQGSVLTIGFNIGFLF